MKEVRIIKRYQNRKLYDTHQSCYVTLEEIAQIIRDGHEIQVIDNRSKDDITYMTQVQLLFDQERKSVNASDTELLKEVIRTPEGTMTGYIRSLLKAVAHSTSKNSVDTTMEPLTPHMQPTTGVETTTSTLN